MTFFVSMKSLGIFKKVDSKISQGSNENLKVVITVVWKQMTLRDPMLLSSEKSKNYFDQTLSD